MPDRPTMVCSYCGFRHPWDRDNFPDRSVSMCVDCSTEAKDRMKEPTVMVATTRDVMHSPITDALAAEVVGAPWDCLTCRDSGLVGATSNGGDGYERCPDCAIADSSQSRHNSRDSGSNPEATR